MSDTTPVLSISMLVSGKKDMEKSLSSLHFFREAFPCEVILVDTGCNAEQRAIAERYGDKVIDFPWCNDFGAARNAGLKEARGEWFMYLDDDEWFDNPREIVSFFTTGEYKKYNSASYVARNYTDVQGQMYGDSYPSRMVKLEPDTVFVGKIHEYLEPFKLPMKQFKDFVHHYGYAYSTEEERKEHSARNVAPLLELRREQPGEPRWMCQLAQEYQCAGDYEKLLECCQEGLAEWNARREDGDYGLSHVGAVYGYLLIALEQLERFDEEKEWLEKALSEPIFRFDFMQPTIAFFCMAGARAFTKAKDHEQSRNFFRRYIDYTKKLRDNRQFIEAGSATIVADVFQEQLLYGTILLCMESAIFMQDHALAEEAFFMMDWSDKRLLRQTEWERKMLNACCSVDWHPLWGKIMETLVSRKDGMKEMLVVFLETEVDYKNRGEAEKLSRLHRLAAAIQYEHHYLLSMHILWAAENPETDGEEKRREEVDALFDRLFEQYPEKLLETRNEVWDTGESFQLDMESKLFRVSYPLWRRKVADWRREASIGDIRRWEARIERWQRQEDIRYRLLREKCRETYLLRWKETFRNDLGETERLLWQYADSVLALYRPYYKEEVFESMTEILPEEVQLSLKLKELQQYREQEDIRGALECVRGCLEICRGLEPAMGAYAKLYRDEASRQNSGAKNEQQELMKIVETLKFTARMQIKKGQYEAAREILLQVQQCAPGDEEVKKLLRQTERDGETE